MLRITQEMRHFERPIMDPAGDLIQVPNSSSAALRRPILRHSSITVRIAVSGRATGSSGYAGVLRTWVCRGLRSQNRSRQGAYRLEASYSGQPVAVRASRRANPKIAVTLRCPDTMIALRICDWGGESGGHSRRSPTAAQSVLSRTSIRITKLPLPAPRRRGGCTCGLLCWERIWEQNRVKPMRTRATFGTGWTAGLFDQDSGYCLCQKAE